MRVLGCCKLKIWSFGQSEVPRNFSQENLLIEIIGKIVVRAIIGRIRGWRRGRWVCFGAVGVHHRRHERKDRRGAAVLAADKRHVLARVLGHGLQQIGRQKRTGENVAGLWSSCGCGRLCGHRLGGLFRFCEEGRALYAVPRSLTRRANAVVGRPLACRKFLLLSCRQRRLVGHFSASRGT